MVSTKPKTNHNFITCMKHQVKSSAYLEQHIK